MPKTREAQPRVTKRGDKVREKKKLTLPVVVEGKYDKNTLSQLFDGVIISVGGFGIFNSKEKQALIRKIGENGIILLTDSDGGGRQIRQFLSGILPKDAVKHIYIPKIEGKERRKTKASRAGLLGVEGMRPEVLTEILAPFTDGAVAETEKVLITKLDFYNDGLSGTENSSDRRAALARSYGLPDDISASALLEALNLISDRNEYKERLSELYSQIAY